MNLETAAGSQQSVKDIGVHGEIQKIVVTAVVMRHFFTVPGAPRSLSEILDRCKGVLV